MGESWEKSLADSFLIRHIQFVCKCTKLFDPNTGTLLAFASALAYSLLAPACAAAYFSLLAAS